MTSPPGSGGAPRRRLLALAGFMGSGKTTIGHLLAKHLGWHFADLDTLVEQAVQLTVTRIFEQHGEPAFRQIEREQLVAALGRAAEFERPTVLALGGGTVAQPGNMELLHAAGAAVVWLDCPLEQLIVRCVLVTTRPLFRDETGFRALYDQRLPYYRQADYRVETGDDPRLVVERILALGLFGADPSDAAPPAKDMLA